MKKPIIKQRTVMSPRVDQTKPASIVINKFGGLTKFCEITGYPTSTAHGWTVSGYIPAHRKGLAIHAHIMGIAQEHGIKLKPADFVDAAPVAA